MKQVAAKARPAARASRRIPQAKAAPEAAVRAANHVRAGGVHEQQADAAAQRVIQGERAVGALLTPTAPAAARIPGSPGEALPERARLLLEDRFGAELGAVRIHRDPAAEHAARSYGALAFTAGRDIFFAKDAFDPSSHTGLLLLAHEVAHVLQQTGQKTADGTLHATAVEGAGELQLKPIPAPSTVPFTRPTMDPALELTKIIERQEGHWGAGDPDLKAAIDWVLDLVMTRDGGTYTSGSLGNAGVEIIKQLEDGVDGNPAARSFLVEVLATSATESKPDGWKGARLLLERDTTFEIATPDQYGGFFTWLMMKVPKAMTWFAPALEHPRLKGFLAGVPETYRLVATDPWGAVPDLWGTDSTIAKGQPNAGGLTWAAQKALLADDKKPTVSERVRGAMMLLNAVDDDRRAVQAKVIAEATEAAKGKRVSRWEIRATIADRLATGLKGAGAKLYPDQADPRRRIQDRCEKVVTDAAEGWKKGAEAGRALRDATGKVSFEGLADPETVAKLAGSVPDTEPLTSLHTLVLAEYKKLIDLPGGAFPDAATYKARVDAFVAALAGKSRGYGGFIWELQKQISTGTGGKGPAFTEAMALATIIVESLIDSLDGYEAARDAKESKWTDIRAAHRWRFSLVVGKLAGYLRWADVLPLAAGILVGADQESQVYFPLDWKEDAGAKPSQMLEELPADDSATDLVVGSDTVQIALSARNLVRFFQVNELEILNAKLKEQIDKYKTEDITRDTQLPIDAINAAIKAAPQPTRWAPGDFVWARNIAKQKDEKTFEASSALIKRNQKFRDQVPIPSGLGLRILPKNDWLRVYAWLIPDLQPLIKRLRAIPELVKLVAETTSEADEKAYSDWEWFVWLSRSADIKPAIKAAQAELDKQEGTERGTLRKQLRQLTTIRRQILTAGFKADLKTWESGGGRVTSVGALAVLPETIVRDVHRFGGDIEPYQDLYLQQSLVLLDIADELESALTKHQQKIPFSMAPLIVKALAYVSDPETKKELDAAAPDVLAKGDSLAEVLKRGAKLEAVLKALKDSAAEWQLRFGFQSEDGVTLKSLVYAATIAPGEVFEIDGVEYELIKVHRPFVFHPEIADAKLPAILKTKREGGADIERDLPLVTLGISDPQGRLPWNAREKAGPKDPASEEEEAQRLQEEMQDPDRRVVTGRHEVMLRQLSHVVEMEAAVRGMQRLGETIEFVAEAGMTVAQVVLPGGAVVTAAQIMAGVVTFLASDEWKELKALLSEDPGVIVDKLKTKVGEAFSPETIWGFIFGTSGGVLERLAQLKSLTSRKSHVPAGKPQPAPRGRLGKIVRAIVNLGKKFLAAIMGLKRKFKGPIAALRSTIMTRPRLGWTLNKGVEILLTAIKLVGEAASFKDQITAQATEAKEDVVEFVKGLAELELPKEIVPVDNVLALVIDFVIGKIPKVKLLRPFLGALGVTDQIAKLVTEGLDLKGGLFDPNTLYRTEVLPLVEKEFVKVRDRFVADLYALINLVGAEVGFTIDPPAATESVKPKEVEFDHVEQAPSLTVEPKGGPAELPSGGGEPLAGDLLASAQERFGQDFGHVRVHADSTAGRLTESLGADALASGSHVFLRPGLSPATGRGAEVFDHELAHVVQQTGSRALGGDHPDEPVRGTPELGVRYDAGREAAASRAASEARAGGGRPTAGGVAAALGIQPDFKTDVLPGIVHELTAFRGEKGAGAFKTVVADPTAEIGEPDVAKKIWDQIYDRFAKPRKGDFAPFIGHDPALVEDAGGYIYGKLKEVREDYKGIAALASHTATFTTGKGKNAKSEQRRVLDEKRFVTIAEGYIYAKTGFAMQIELFKTKREVKGVTVNWVHLAYIGGTSKLWQAAMKTPGLGATDDERRKHQRQIREYVTYEGPNAAFVWHPALPKFEFAPEFMAAYLKRLQEAKTKGRPSEVKPAKEYVGSTVAQQHGLALGTHRELTAAGHAERKNRESHHTTQFLLVEFYRNRNKTKAFPVPANPAEDYFSALGLTKGTAFIDTIKTGGKTFALRDLDPTDSDGGARGNEMPAILVSRDTHVDGPLHVDDDEDEGADGLSQGGKIQREFIGALGAKYGPAFASAALLKKEVDQDAAAVGTAVAKAMQHTFTWMYHGIMKGGLRTGLLDIEQRYYHEIAAETPGAIDTTTQKLTAEYTLTDDMLTDVAKAAEKQNEDKISKHWNK